MTYTTYNNHAVINHTAYNTSYLRHLQYWHFYYLHYLQYNTSTNSTNNTNANAAYNINKNN